MRIISTISLLLFISLQIVAENEVFTDETFPYRIVCKPEWSETAKAEDTLTLEKTSQGKKMRFQLIKDKIDTSFFDEPMKWSLLNFMINKELASATGRLVFFDTSTAIKLGDNRAYELFAFFCDTSGTENVWWADYCRWTDFDGFGYFVSIIGDTVDMKEHYDDNQSLLDSISFSNESTLIYSRGTPPQTPVYKIRTFMQPFMQPTYYDILGRALSPAFTDYRNRLMVGKKLKQCKIR